MTLEERNLIERQSSTISVNLKTYGNGVFFVRGEIGV